MGRKLTEGVMPVVIDSTGMTPDEVEAFRRQAEREGHGVMVPGSAKPDPGVLAVAAMAAAAAVQYPSLSFGGGYHKQTLADRTPPRYRRFPVPKRK